MNKKNKIVMISMFKNESRSIRRMLESCYRYIDYWILQDNGSTDGTPDIVNDFFKDKNIPGFVYKVEEGWIGFGWNRDHLLQKCLNTDHNCDWILKMDCDEILEVDDDFDWTLLNDNSIQSFNIPAKNGSIFYFRTWMYNARLPWKFNHDIAHETIYLDMDNIGENFQRIDLPFGFRQIGTRDGESYTIPTKYISDSLKLEEKMIRENTMLTDIYHFWYIAKSYFDCYANENIFPLRKKHCIEYARRALFYFEEYLNFTHNFFNTKEPKYICEIGYLTLVYMGNTYEFLKNDEKAFECYIASHKFCPERNDHFINLYNLYFRYERFEDALEISKFLLKRKNPFPKYNTFINFDFYYDTGSYIYFLNEQAMQKLQSGVTHVR